MRRNLLLILILAAAAGIALWVRGLPSAQIDPDIPIEGHEQASPEVSGTGPELAGPLATDKERESQVPTEGPTANTPDSVLRLMIVDAANQAPIAGVRAYLGEEILGGPSDTEGWLEFTPPLGRRTTFWAQGWSPREFHSRAMPESRVELTSATATLEVFVDHLAPEEKVLLNRLEPMGWTATNNTAWSQPLQTLAPHHLQGGELPAGRYQLYVWIGAFQAQGIALEPVEVELEPGQKTVVRLDANVRPDDEVDS